MKKSLVMMLALTVTSGSVFAQPASKAKPKVDCSNLSFVAKKMFELRLSGAPYSSLQNLVERSKADPKNPDVNKVHFAEYLKPILKEMYSVPLPKTNDMKVYSDIVHSFTKKQVAKCNSYNRA